MRCALLPALLFAIIGGCLMIQAEALSSRTIKSSVSSHHHSSSSGAGPTDTSVNDAVGRHEQPSSEPRTCKVSRLSQDSSFRLLTNQCVQYSEVCVVWSKAIHKFDTPVQGECRDADWIDNNMKKEGLERVLADAALVIYIPALPARSPLTRSASTGEMDVKQNEEETGGAAAAAAPPRAPPAVTRRASTGALDYSPEKTKTGPAGAPNKPQRPSTA